MTDHDLKRRLQIAGRTQEELAEALRISSHSASRLVRGARKMSAAESDAIEQWLEDAAGEMPVVKKQPLIPMYGYAQANNGDRVAFTSDKVLEWVEAPPFTAIEGVLAMFRVVGISMEPRLFEAEKVVVKLNLRPARNQDCVIEFYDGTADIKTYERSRDGFVYARQYNPEKEVRYASKDVKALHAVMSRMS